MTSAFLFFVYINVAKQKPKRGLIFRANFVCLFFSFDKQTLHRVRRAIEGKLDTVKMFYASFFRHVRYNRI